MEPFRPPLGLGNQSFKGPTSSREATSLFVSYESFHIRFHGENNQKVYIDNSILSVYLAPSPVSDTCNVSFHLFSHYHILFR